MTQPSHDLDFVGGLSVLGAGYAVRSTMTKAAGTGLRQGEAFGLSVDRVDFLRRAMTVDRQLVTVQGAQPYLGPPKTSASVRTVPLPTVFRRR